MTVRQTIYFRSSQKKSAFHLSKKCFVPMYVAMMFPKGSVLVDRFNVLLMRASQGGFMNKLVSDVAWDQQRSATGQLLQVKSLWIQFRLQFFFFIKSVWPLGFYFCLFQVRPRNPRTLYTFMHSVCCQLALMATYFDQSTWNSAQTSIDQPNMS